MKVLVGLLSALLILSAVGLVFAQPNLLPATNTKSKVGTTVTIPPNAVQVADNVFSLGTARDVDGREVQGFMFIHKQENAKPPGTPGGGKGGTTCYAFLAKGAKWKVLEPWVINPANSRGLDEGFIFNNEAANIQKWEDASSYDILGAGSTTNSTLVADTSSTDGQNEVYFGDVDSPGAIAVTIVWGIFYGPPGQRELVEWDQVYDQVDFDWSSTGEADKMDFENIATHELGHTVGMGHPDDSCTEETMYRYASYGETKKQDLNSGDIAGIQALY
ncbi:MAG: matrixin family metalloprotease [Candidatus Aenigmarchaeota archaeon]|nr:matrixin family metalloprotease [Candidatus Aenigmarchaeota archaeon]